MAVTFCTNCGAKYEFTGFAPNFCSKCGTQMNGTKASVPTRDTSKRPFASRNQVADDDEENTDIDSVPELDKLDVDIEIEGGFRTFSLEEISRSPHQAQARKFVPRRVSGIDGLSPTKYGSPKDAK